MELFADRFVLGARGRAVDLATGDEVVIRVESSGGQSDERRWMDRCDFLHRLRHPCIAGLVDYGVCGAFKRFEAWRCDGPWRGSSAVADRAARRAKALFDAGALGADGSVGPVHEVAGRAAVVVSPDSGYVRTSVESSGPHALPLENHAILRIERRELAGLTELFESAASWEPRVVGLWGPPGAGKSMLAGQLARAARLHGRVPLAIRFVGSSLSTAVRDRSILLIDDESNPHPSDGSTRWTRLVDLVLLSPRAHILLYAGREDVTGVTGAAIGPFSVEALVASLWPLRRGDLRVQRLAVRASGNPARFAALLWRRDVASSVGGARIACRVAEQRATYGEPVANRDDVALRQEPGWPARELSMLRGRMHAAMRQLDAGFHAPGSRALRQAIGGLSRRGDWAGAAEGAIALASSHLKRGRVSDSKAVLDTARQYCGRAEIPEPLTPVAVLYGHAHIDAGRLDEAENVLRIAVAAARTTSDASAAAPASQALARCLFWRGRFDDADEALASAACAGANDRTMARLCAIRARVAVGRRDLSGAIAAGAEAVDRSLRIEDWSLQADARCALAFAHLAVGDAEAVRSDVAACLVAAKQARDPLRAIRARLLLAEQERRSGRLAGVTRLVNRLTRLKSTILPAVVGERRDLLVHLISSAGPVQEIVARRVAATGLRALALFVPAEPAEGTPPVLTEVIDILQMCQDAVDDVASLAAVCARLHHRLRAVSVTFFSADSGSCSVLARDGGRIEPEVAMRAISAGIAIEPHRREARVECAVPIRYGGSTIGALAARWVIGTPSDMSKATALLEVSAAAAAPLVAAARAARQGSPADQGTPIIGVSTAIVELRQAITRAARAPFAVLIHGESGSGKELVARGVHQLGTRAGGPFCTLNCAAVPDDLIEAELFGHARGAFTGAIAERHGVFEEADGGTLFLDEIGELSARAQAKLLRVIQEGEIRRIGENVARRVDVRIVSATNRDLGREVEAGRFRMDLLYRLDVIRLVVPPLRDRREDIALLAERFWRELAGRVGSRATLGAAAIAALARYDWPGNVRELQNVLAALVVRSGKRGAVPEAALPPQFTRRGGSESWRLDQARRTFEERFVRAALVRAGGRRAQAAADLGVSRQGLTKMMIRLGIEADR